MKPPSTHELTQLLLAWSDGDQTALEKLTPLVYAELRRLAERYMSREGSGAIFRVLSGITLDC